MIDARTFSLLDVARMALVTARQLQWWDEQGILVPDQSTGKRLYSTHQVCAAMLYRELHERGLKLAAFRAVCCKILEQGVTLPDTSRRWLLTDGKRVVFLEHPDVVLAFLEQRRKPVFALIPLAPFEMRIEGAGLELPERRGPMLAHAAAANGSANVAAVRRA